MKFSKLNYPNNKVNVNLSKYKIDWEKGGSKPHLKVKQFLEPYWQCFQVVEEFPIPGSKLRIDILNASQKICIEISPSSSHDFNPFFHKSRVSGFLASLNRDEAKEGWILENGFQYICLGDEDLKNLTRERFKAKFNCEL